MADKYDDGGWSPITLKIKTKTKLSDFKKASESWTEAIDRLLKIAKDGGF